MLSDEVWQVIVDCYQNYDNIELTLTDKLIIEQHTQIKSFDGGVIIYVKNEFDVFIVPSMRGKWKIRKVILNFLADLAKTYPVAKVRIDQRNIKSLRLAYFFGFSEVNREGQKIDLEKKLWAAS